MIRKLTSSLQVTSNTGFKTHGTDFAKIASLFSNPELVEGYEEEPVDEIFPRTVGMIEAMWLKNKTWLSLASANAKDLAAIMKDHYNYIEEINNSPIKEE